MRPTKNPRIKICCIGSAEEARLAILHGASALGLVSQMPSGPGVIAEALISAIARSVPPPVATFLLTSLRAAASIIDQQRRCGTNTIQLCDRVEPGAHQELRKALPGISIVQVIHVRGDESLAEAVEMAPHVHALLLDSGNPSLEVKELGGTGKVHDWQVSKKIRESVSIPIFLAGGLQPGNVREAIGRVEPFGVDVCSGVRTNGRLDETKLKDFIDAAQ